MSYKYEMKDAGPIPLILYIVIFSLMYRLGEDWWMVWIMPVFLLGLVGVIATFIASIEAAVDWFQKLKEK